MAEKDYQLEILTPLSSVFKGDVEYIVAPGVDGLFGILVNHAPMLSGLNFGPLFVRTSGGQERWFVISDGFFEIKNNKASILVDTAEAREAIDVQRAEMAKQRAEQRLKEKQADIDLDRAKAALQRALTRIETAGK